MFLLHLELNIAQADDRIHVAGARISPAVGLLIVFNNPGQFGFQSCAFVRWNISRAPCNAWIEGTLHPIVGFCGLHN